MSLLTENKPISNTERKNKKLQKMITNNYIIKSGSVEGSGVFCFNDEVLQAGQYVIVGHYNEDRLTHRKYGISYVKDSTLAVRDGDGLLYYFNIEMFIDGCYEIFDLI